MCSIAANSVLSRVFCGFEVLTLDSKGRVVKVHTYVPLIIMYKSPGVSFQATDVLSGCMWPEFEASSEYVIGLEISQ